MWRRKIPGTTALLSLLALGLASAGRDDDDDDECAEVAKATYKADKAGAKEDYWIAIAKCINHDDDDDGCREDAEDQLEEDLELARARKRARLELCEMLGGEEYDPDLDDDEFGPNVDNEYFPLVPGRTLVYEKQSSEGFEHVEITTLFETRDIDGVQCRVVQDTAYLDGEVVEDTTDWYAQHDDGTVWYYGEIALNYEDGFLDNVDGSWRTDVDGALPGILMLAEAHVGDVYRQEYLIGEAEDVALVLATDETVTVAAGTFEHCVKTEDWTPIEPGNYEHKYYAPGIGLVLEVDVASGERLELVQIR